MSDLVERLRSRASAFGVPKVSSISPTGRMLDEAANEIERLQRWKAEAIQVAEEWEKVWEALGCPGRLGESKAKAVLDVVSSRDVPTTDTPTT